MLCCVVKKVLRDNALFECDVMLCEWELRLDKRMEILCVFGKFKRV